MKNKIVLVDLGYYHSADVNDYKQLMLNFENASGHHDYLGANLELHVIRHLNQFKNVKIGDVNYHFLKGSNSKLWLPFKLHRFVKSLRPDVILLHGYSNPIQVLLLSFRTRAKLVIQDHGGSMPSGITGFFQKNVVKYLVKNYFFTSKEQVIPFIAKGLIHKNSMIYEVMEGSTYKKQIQKSLARKALKLPENEIMFLWVGRLDKNKDPITVLKGIELFFKEHESSRLDMIYSDRTLEKEVQNYINASAHLKTKVRLIGNVDHTELDNYYSSADYFILGSHYEGSGFALCESLACGCIPIVTAIPSFKKMTNNGALGVLWEPGNVQSLLNALVKAIQLDSDLESTKTMRFFEQNLSFQAIAHFQVEAIKKIIE